MIGKKIKQLRESKHISQKSLSDKCGVSVSYIQQLEYGKKENPSIEVLNKLANALGVTINDLVGSKKTVTQEIIDELLHTKGLTLEQIATQAQIPIDELTAMYENKDHTMGALINLAKFTNATDEQIYEWLLSDVFINSIYNNNNNDPELNRFKKIFLGEPLSLQDVLLNAADEEDKEFLTSLYNAGALNFTDQHSNSNPQHDTITFNNDDLDMAGNHIEYLLQFIKANDYPVEKLNRKTVRYIYEKVKDLLDFEFYKLEKNNFNFEENNQEK